MNARQQLTGLDHDWLPFTPNHSFQDHPKILGAPLRRAIRHVFQRENA